MTTRSDAVAKVLQGSVDLHCHSGPSPFPRRFDHVEAALDAQERLGMRAIVVKSHHHNTVMDVLAMAPRLRDLRTRVFGGIALNSFVGGLNPHAVRMSLRMGGKVVWFPTMSSGRHIECHHDGDGFPTETVPLTCERVDIRDSSGGLRPEVGEILDVVKETGALLSGGHMYPDDIQLLFEEAGRKGIRRMIVNHPNFVIGAEPGQCEEFVRLGAFIEHEVAMYDPEGHQRWDPKLLVDWIERIGPGHTVLSSDLGQKTNPKPVDAYLRVCGALLDLGVREKDLQRMTRDNPSYLLGLD
ncbi:DUF6282 family protein [Amycolatopsis alkalitolerans]|uniref:Cytosolic protein n=1 Tax=Amycolatopsis alkalitolerans TaxID=2547244 RepID=A0A5C4MD93_9PSEU|nr:DUF6282 family protein [Amycolatopsis alkalitolerans]TNC29513.1 hypothetical protein FG385_00620 [Amycolatopsis alkalitolerans]